jgi:hypothetical protein
LSKDDPFRTVVATLLATEPALLSVGILRRTNLAGYNGGKSPLYELVESLRSPSAYISFESYVSAAAARARSPHGHRCHAQVAITIVIAAMVIIMTPAVCQTTSHSGSGGQTLRERAATVS